MFRRLRPERVLVTEDVFEDKLAVRRPQRMLRCVDSTVEMFLMKNSTL